MSQHSSFTSEYIYNRSDYKILRERANKWNDTHCLHFFPEVNDELPIISGKVTCLAPFMEDMELNEFLYGVVTEKPVSFIILSDGHDIGDNKPILKVTKLPDGETELSHFFDSGY